VHIQVATGPSRYIAAYKFGLGLYSIGVVKS